MIWARARVLVVRADGGMHYRVRAQMLVVRGERGAEDVSRDPPGSGITPPMAHVVVNRHAR